MIEFTMYIFPTNLKYTKQNSLQKYKFQITRMYLIFLYILTAETW